MCNGENGTDGQDGSDGANGSDGADGQDGSDGLDADQFMFAIFDASLISCPNGGFDIEYGIDVDRHWSDG